MVLDTSALLALLLDEPEAEEFRAAVEEDTTRLVSAATLLETAVVRQYSNRLRIITQTCRPQAKRRRPASR